MHCPQCVMKIYKEKKGRYLNLLWISASIAKTKYDHTWELSNMNDIREENMKTNLLKTKKKKKKTMLKTQCME